MSTKEFYLHNSTITLGREMVAKRIKAVLPSFPFPPAATGLLTSYVDCVETSAATYLKYFNEGLVHSDMVFNEAVSVSSNATVAAELAGELRWVSRVCYDCTHDEAVTITQPMRVFANEVNRLLNVMYIMALSSRDSNNGDKDENSPEKLCFERRQRLLQALYLADLGVKITCPDHYVYHHPEASKWLSLRASIRRAESAGQLDSAKADEALASKYRGKTQH